jgi:hypothetical protein
VVHSLPPYSSIWNYTLHAINDSVAVDGGPQPGSVCLIFNTVQSLALLATQRNPSTWLEHAQTVPWRSDVAFPLIYRPAAAGEGRVKVVCMHGL